MKKMLMIGLMMGAMVGCSGNQNMTQVQAVSQVSCNDLLTKLFNRAQEANRRAEDREMISKKSLAKAIIFEKAVAEEKKDPTLLILAADLNPVQYYRDLTSYALTTTKSGDASKEDFDRILLERRLASSEMELKFREEERIQEEETSKLESLFAVNCLHK